MGLGPRGHSPHVKMERQERGSTSDSRLGCRRLSLGRAHTQANHGSLLCRQSIPHAITTRAAQHPCLQGAAAVCEALMGLASLTALDLRENSIRAGGANAGALGLGSG